MDLAFRGVDLGELWRARQWRKLANLVDHLPRNSFFVEAVSEDEELAEALIEADRPLPPARERLAEWSPEVEALAAAVDRLGSLIATQIAGFGGKPPRVRPYPRPRTALERARTQRQRAALDDITRKLLNRQ